MTIVPARTVNSFGSNVKFCIVTVATAAAAGTLGVAPWLAFFVLHGSAVVHGQTVTGSRFADLKHTVTQVLPTALIGGEKRAGATWALANASSSHLKVLGAGIYVGVVVYTVVVASRGKLALAACGKKGPPQPPGPPR